MTNPDVEKIVREYLTEHGYDGLFDPNNEDGCGCTKDNLYCCDAKDVCSSECTAGYRKTDDKGYWTIQGEKPPRAATLPTIAEVTGIWKPVDKKTMAEEYNDPDRQFGHMPAGTEM